MTKTRSTKPVKVPVPLAPDELAALDEGIRSAQIERRYTPEEAVEFARQRRRLWKTIPKATSA